MTCRSSLILAGALVALAFPAKADMVPGSVPIQCYMNDELSPEAKFEPLITDAKGRVWGVMSIKDAPSMIAVRKDGATCFVVSLPPTT